MFRPIFKALLKSVAVISCCVLLSACKSLQIKTLFSDSKEVEQKVAIDNYDEFALDPDCFVTDAEHHQYVRDYPLDLWARIRDGYALPDIDNRRVQMELNWYAKHPDYMQRVTERGGRYLYHIVNELEQRNMPMEIALLPIVESAFDPFAYSHGRASGMWQIIPGTGKMLGLKQNWWYDGRRDVVASTDAALTYLQRLHKRFDGDWLLALASYNSGAGNVSKAIRKNKRRGKPTDFWNLDLPRETEAYVPRLLALARLVHSPEDYYISLYSIANQPYFVSVPVASQIDLAQAAALADVEMDVLYHLNPAFNRWATDPDGPHELLVPADKAEIFVEAIAAIPAHERVIWKRYKIKSGDTLSTIASRHNLTVQSLKSINQLRGSTIRAGQTLMLPIAAESDSHYSHSLESRIARRYTSVEKNQESSAIEYTVQPGDSLWEIGRQFKVSTSKIARWNSMAPRDPLMPGQILKIWTDEPTVPQASNAVIRKVSYRVRSGDSLARIAQKFGVSINDIVRWNNINRSKYLQPGQSLTLFIDVTQG